MEFSTIHGEDLAALGSDMAVAPWIALDTEANSMFVYRERTCLVQLNVGGRLCLIDCVVLEPEGPRAATLLPLKAALEDPCRPVLIHGGEYDAGILKRDYGICLAGVWDTQQAASMLGYEKTGYGSLVEAVCGVQLAKSHTLHDWGRRPLDPTAARYALDDVRYLPEVHERLAAELRAADLEEEHAIACRAVEEATFGGGFEPRGFWRIKGLREQPNEALPLIYALYLWRDDRARLADYPAGRLMNDELMLSVARKAPQSGSGLSRLGLKRWLIDDHGSSLVEAIAQAQASPPELPERPSPRQAPSVERAREQRLKDWRKDEAVARSKTAGRKVPQQVVLPAKSLEHLARYGAAELPSVPQLGPKRSRLYGAVLAELCR